jgi:hypothetical protein
MADRAVYRSGKDDDGDITALCASGASWSPRLKEDAIGDIISGLHTYHVPLTSGARAEIRVVDGPSGPYLRTDWDHTTKNNLDDLPDC